MEMLEKEIENKLVKKVKAAGGLAFKMTSSDSVVGIMDRLCLLPGGKLGFVECKRPGGTLRPIQIRRKQQLEALGYRVYVLDSLDKAEEIIHDIASS